MSKKKRVIEPDPPRLTSVHWAFIIKRAIIVVAAYWIFYVAFLK